MTGLASVVRAFLLSSPFRYLVFPSFRVTSKDVVREINKNQVWFTDYLRDRSIRARVERYWRIISKNLSEVRLPRRITPVKTISLSSFGFARLARVVKVSKASGSGSKNVG